MSTETRDPLVPDLAPGARGEWRGGTRIEAGTYLGPDEWKHWARIDWNGSETLVRGSLLRPAGELAAEDAALADLIKRAAGYPVGDDEHAARSREHGFPWCDTCKRPSVGREGEGLLHSTVEHPFGVPRALDDSGHEVTHREWFQVPL